MGNAEDEGYVKGMELEVAVAVVKVIDFKDPRLEVVGIGGNGGRGGAGTLHDGS